MKTIPDTDLTVSAICLGSTHIGVMDQPYELLDAYLDMGGNFIDTAWVYANWLPGERHSSEKTIGRWLKAHNIPRDKVVIGTKGAHPEMETMHIPRVTPDDIRLDVQTSLANLQVDAIDLYYLHRDDETKPLEPIIDALEDEVKAGNIRYYGCSNWKASRIKAANAYAKSAGYTGFVADQPLWSMAQVNPEAISDPTLVALDDDLYAYHVESDMAIIPYSSQAKGYYTKWAALGLENLPDDLRAQYDNAVTRKRYDIAQEIMQRTGYTINQIALAFLIQQPVTTIPVVGCKNLDHLTASMSALDVTLSDEDFSRLQAAK